MDDGADDMPLLTDLEVEEDDRDDAWNFSESLHISIDLISAAKRFLVLLKDVSCRPELREGPAVTNAIRRYEKFWLPLANLLSEGDLAGMAVPVDIWWVWCCHRLSPESYARDCTRLLGRVLSCPPPKDDLCPLPEEKLARCHQAWSLAYPTEPFYPETPPAGSLDEANSDSSPGALPGHSIELESRDQGEEADKSESKFGGEGPRHPQLDLAAAVAHHWTFFHQVDRPWMQEPRYLAGTLRRYRMFLGLLQRRPGEIFVPTADIDLLWHAHMMSPGQYADDSSAALGYLAERQHDADFTESTPDRIKRLEWIYQATSKAWESLYGIPYARAGAMIRPLSTPSLFLFPEASSPKGREVPQQPMGDVNEGLGLAKRHVLQAHITLWGLASFPLEASDPLYLRMGMISRAPSMALETKALRYGRGWPLPTWRQSWWLDCEEATDGIVVELLGQRGPFLDFFLGPRSFGQAVLTWKELQAQPGIMLAKELTLSGDTWQAVSGAMPPKVRLAISATPVRVGPYLLRSSRTIRQLSDDSGAMVCEEMLIHRQFIPQEGRWISKTFIDHSNREAFIMRVRSATGAWTGGQRPFGVLPRERVILLHVGGWSYIDTSDGMGGVMDPQIARVGVCEGPAVAQAVPQPSPDFSQEQTFLIIGCGEVARLRIARDRHLETWLDTVSLELSQDNSPPVTLLVGRHLEYAVSGASLQAEAGYATVVRQVAGAMQPRAVALLDWRAVKVEVTSQESVPLALLLCGALHEALLEMQGISRDFLYGPPPAKTTARELPPALSSQWDSSTSAAAVAEDDGFDGEDQAGAALLGSGGNSKAHQFAATRGPPPIPFLSEAPQRAAGKGLQSMDRPSKYQSVAQECS